MDRRRPSYDKKRLACDQNTIPPIQSGATVPLNQPCTYCMTPAMIISKESNFLQTFALLCNEPNNVNHQPGNYKYGTQLATGDQGINYVSKTVLLILLSAIYSRLAILMTNQ